MKTTADLILRNGSISTLDPAHPEATEVVIIDGKIAGVDDASDFDVGPETKVVDLGGRRVIPGLYDSHQHVIRGGLNYNMELRWEGVPSLGLALEMLRAQAARTPAPQWVRVVGGWSEFQFAERRMPTLEEINEAAPDTPVFILHLYCRALLNRAALRACGINKDTPDPPGGEIVARPRGQSDGHADRASQRDDPVRDPREGAKAAARVPVQLDTPLHARAESARRHERVRRWRRVPELSGRLRDHPAAARARRDDRAHRLQPVHAEPGRRARRLHALVEDDPAGRRRRHASRATAPARCSSSPRPTSRTSSSRGPTCPRSSRASSSASYASSQRTAGHSGSTRRTTSRSPASSTSSRRSIATCRSTGCTGSSTTARRSRIATSSA